MGVRQRFHAGRRRGRGGWRAACGRCHDTSLRCSLNLRRTAQSHRAQGYRGGVVAVARTRERKETGYKLANSLQSNVLYVRFLTVSPASGALYRQPGACSVGLPPLSSPVKRVRAVVGLMLYKLPSGASFWTTPFWCFSTIDPK